MIIANTVKELVAAVHLAADGSQVDSGIIFCVARLESDDADNGKFWDANDDTWQVAPVAWPEATYSKAAQWIFALPAAASNGKIYDSTHYTMTDDLDESAATTVCGGGEHRINAENPLTTSDLSNLDAAVSSRATPANVTTNTSTVTAAIIVGSQSVMGQLEIVKGLLHHNSMLDRQVYDGDRLLSARLRVFDEVANIPGDEDGDEVTGKIAEFTVESEYGDTGLNTKFVLKRVFP